MPVLDDVKVYLIATADEAYDFSRWMSTTNNVAIDAETTGLDTYVDKVRILQVGNEDTAWVIPIEGPASWSGLAIDVLKRYTGHIDMHHFKFDLNMIDTTLGVQLDVSKIDDTMLMARVLEPTRPAALKTLTTRYVDSRASVAAQELDDAMKGGKHTWATVPLDFQPYWFYAGIDTVLTRHLSRQLRPRVTASAEQPYQLELGAAAVCGRMERHGALIDHDYASQVMRNLEQYIDESTKWCLDNYNVKPGSNASIVKILQNDGFTFSKATATGAVALDKEVLGGIDHPLAQTVLQRRQSQKVVSAYLRHFVHETDVDGRIHPRINSCGARTARMSMDNPNLQNLPRRGTTSVADAVRSCIVARPGCTLLMCDFDQIEWRLFASLSQDPNLAAAFQADDFFTEMCRQVFNDETITKKDPRRQITKNAMYARIYGAGDTKFAKTADITVDEARRFNAMLDLSYPTIRRLQQAIDGSARRRMTEEGEAYVLSPLTGRRYVIDPDEGRRGELPIYKLVNYLFQGTAAEVLKMKLIELSQAGLEEYMVVPVHDEIIMEVPDEDLRDVAMKVHDVMNDPNLFGVPITASLAAGRSWGSKVDYEL